MLTGLLLSLAMVVPHATFRGTEAKVLFRNYLPGLVANRIIHNEFNGHLSKVISLLKQDNAFIVCSNTNNAFVCTDNGSTHVIEAVIFEDGDDALMDLKNWHDTHFHNVSLELA